MKTNQQVFDPKTLKQKSSTPKSNVQKAFRHRDRGIRLGRVRTK